MTSSSSGPVKSPLHNFPIPPTFFKWGPTTALRRRSSTPPPPPDPPSAKPDPEQPEADKPWKLRPRRTATTTTTTPNVSSSSLEHKHESVTITRPSRDKRFFIALSREEIEEDIYAFTGAKPSRRPNKRSKTAQKELDKVFPGLWLVGLSADTYRDLYVPPK